MQQLQLIRFEDDPEQGPGEWRAIPGGKPFAVFLDAKHAGMAEHEATGLRIAVLDQTPRVVWCSDSLHEHFTQADDFTPINEAW